MGIIIKKVKINNTFVNEDINSTKEKGNEIFRETLKKVNKVKNKDNKKKFNVYEIAAKIARGEHVSTEELQYIKENAATLYYEAVEQYEKSKTENNKQNKFGIDCIYSKNQNIDKEKINDDTCDKIEAHNSIMNLS